MATKKKPSAKLPAKPAPADAVDEQLARYREMRDFTHTAEPAGSHQAQKKSTTARGLPFVIQKHAASHLHYDFRLGWNGVLKSWAIAKGPSFVTKDRRLAIQVEDHPMEYGGFEGIIPKGQYGGGTVMVWDQGTWWPQPGHENVDAGLRDGSLKFEMNGTKMKGKWTLVRMGPRSNSTSSSGSRWSNSTKPQWLLIKEHDSFERGPDDPCITDQKPNSAVTGRTLDQIANQEDHVWNSKETAKPGQSWFRREPAKNPDTDARTASQTTSVQERPVILSGAEARPHRASAQSKDLPTRSHPATLSETSGAKPPTFNAELLDRCPGEKQPAFLPPQLALEATAPPTTGGWLHELKLDGYRIQARKSGKKIQLLTRKGLDWTHRMTAVADAVAHLPVSSATLDGEVVVLAANGTSSFADLQASFNDSANHPLTYFAFDLLHLEGRNPRGLPLLERKQLLAAILPQQNDTLRLSEHIEGSGDAIFRHACELHAEGVVSKLAAAPYRASRSSDWLKSKCLREQEFVIAGYTPSTEGPDRIGSLLLGYYPTPGVSTESRHPERSEGPPHLAGSGNNAGGTNSTRTSPANKLIYAGRTGTGFTQKLKRDLLTQLSKLAILKPAFDRLPPAARRDAHWVEPKLVAQVRFATWTADNLVRQAAFLGLREDKPAHEVVREEPSVAPKPKSAMPTKPEPIAATHRTPPAHAAKAQITSTAQKNKPYSTAIKSVILSGAPKRSGGAQSKDPEASHATETARRPSTRDPKTTLRLTHPDKILDPETSLTKRQLADYYLAIADRMLPHIAGRPLSLVRCPEGASQPCFFQKHVTAMLPPGIDSVMVTDKKSGKPEPYITLNPDHATPEILAGFAQMGVLEIHPWGSRNDDLEHPDRLIFDLDPDPSLPWSTLTAAAAEVRQRLKKAGLTSFLKLTGGKGLHIVAPIEPNLDWSTVKEAAHRFVLAMERAKPRLYLTKMTKSARAGKIYLDYLRNERGATAVAPYSPRARLGAHVSLPLPWSALKEAARPIFSVHDFPQWRGRLRTDPWKAMLSTSQHLDPAKL